jgi:hypothetical protein
MKIKTGSVQIIERRVTKNKKEDVLVGIVTKNSHDTITIVHNTKGNHPLDITLVKKDTILQNKEVEPLEINRIEDLESK